MLWDRTWDLWRWCWNYDGTQHILQEIWRPTVTVHADDISHGLVSTQPSMQSHIKAFMAPKFLEFVTLFLTNVFNSCCPFSLWFVLENIYWGYLGHISSVRSNDWGANFENLNPSKHLVYAPTLNHWMNWKARKKSKTKVFELNDTSLHCDVVFDLLSIYLWALLSPFILSRIVLPRLAS